MIKRLPAADTPLSGKYPNADHNQFSKAAYTIIDANDALLVDVQGSWSYEIHLQYFRDIKRHAAPLIGRRWAMLLLLDTWEISTQDSIPILRELSQWFYSHGRTHCAFVYRNDALKNYQLSKVVPPPSLGSKTQRFETLQEACEWLNEAGFTVLPEECERLKNYRH